MGVSASGKEANGTEQFSLVLPVLAVLFVCGFALKCLRLRAPQAACEAAVSENFRFTGPRFSLTKRDTLPMLLLTAVYAFAAFFGLGDTEAPQSFSHFEDRGYYALVELPEGTKLTRVMYYTGLYAGNYYLQFSTDGENWVDQAAMPQSYADLFKWQSATLNDTVQEVRYLRIIAGEKLDLGELALYDETYTLLDAKTFIYDPGVSPLFDEQELVPEVPSYQNSAYFDEIYHARTAYEYIRNVYPYEISHPPLGKAILSLGIRLFGMTPFGWRFSGTLTGVLMLPIFYLFLKNLFGSTEISACGTALFAFDFMHFVQTRIATIDSYGVFFILLMYFFLYRFLSASGEAVPGLSRAQKWDLLLCGLCFGLGAACKWTVLYAVCGVALLWLLFWIFRLHDFCRVGRGPEAWREFFKNCALCLFCFVLLPAVIYYVSYAPYGKASGMSGLAMFFRKDYWNLVIDNQEFMFSYHKDIVAEHPYASRWYQWLLDIRPILYYLHYGENGSVSSFGAFNNPLISWLGLLSLPILAWEALRRRDMRALFLLVGYLSQLLPWVFIRRLTFAYHYFPSLIFLVCGICYLFHLLRLRAPHWRRGVFGFTAAALALFLLFYPVLTGIPRSGAYSALLEWIPEKWPF